MRKQIEQTESLRQSTNVRIEMLGAKSAWDRTGE